MIYASSGCYGDVSVGRQESLHVVDGEEESCNVFGERIFEVHLQLDSSRPMPVLVESVYTIREISKILIIQRYAQEKTHPLQRSGERS
jgi:hypothetical protein